MKNLVLCFDRAGRYPGSGEATNAERLFRMVEETDEQVCWYDAGVRSDDRSGLHRALRWREAAAEDARRAIAEAYGFVVDHWEPGDRVYVFGVGRGGYCAQTLTRLLGTVGVLPDLMDFVVTAYARPRTPRTEQDWRRVTRLAARLSGNREISVPIQFLGIWDALRVPGMTRQCMPDPMPNVVSGRHAVAIDGPLGASLVASASEHIEEVWFRGGHRDVAGGPGACSPLADIALDWMLDGAVAAGLMMTPWRRSTAPAPSECDALAESAHTIGVRRLPVDAVLHASVEIYLRANPGYWRRLPAEVTWADPDWVARSERLLPAKTSPVPVQHRELTAAAS